MNTAFRLAVLGMVIMALSCALFPVTLAYVLSAAMLIGATFGICLVNRGYVKEAQRVSEDSREVRQ